MPIELTPGTRLGAFEILATLGEGGMGAVYRARDTELHREVAKTCGTEVVFPSLNIKRTLPLNEPVAIEFTPERSGEVAFACGMNMLKGIVAVE